MSVGAGRRAVAIGGGTGLPQVLSSLIALGFSTTAIVTVADDGGSSGVLRSELGVLPPGDVRNCLVAMAAEPDGLAARALQYRFEGGDGLAGHTVGNILLAALEHVGGSFPDAIAVVSGLLNVRGRVIPSTLADVHLHGVDRDGNEVFGQASLATSAAPVERAYLEPAEPPAYQPAVEALLAADVVVIGPGSLYTSVIPNFLVEGISEALAASSAKRVYVCNVANQRGETFGFDAADHVAALNGHGLDGAIDVAVVHACAENDDYLCDDEGSLAVLAGPRQVARIEEMGVEVHLAELADTADRFRHSKALLVDALGEVLA